MGATVMESTSAAQKAFRSYEEYAAQTKKGTPPDQTMDKDMFFKILITQLQNQDPMNPMEDRDFIAQLATFSTLEKMTELNSTMQMALANDMVGKSVVAVTKNKNGDEVTVAGKIDSSFMKNGQIHFMMGTDYIFTSDKIQQVFDDGEQFNNLVVNTANLIGKTVKATIPNPDYNEETNNEVEKTIEVTGAITSVTVVNGRIILKMGDKDIEIFQVSEILGGQSEDSAA